MIELLVVIAIIALPDAARPRNVQKVGEAARTQSTNTSTNRPAFHNFHDVFKQMPFNGPTPPPTM